MRSAASSKFTYSPSACASRNFERCLDRLEARTDITDDPDAVYPATNRSTEPTVFNSAVISASSGYIIMRKLIGRL